MRSGSRRGGAAVAGAVTVLALVGGCVSEPAFPEHTAIEVDRPRALYDEAIRTRITGLPPGTTVTVTATTKDPQAGWRSEGRSGPTAAESST
ncbi:hypothetical protein RM572_17095 [Streptomyces sp. DSM 42041]|uniref:Uncharacterized protein n=1 Tax=Streptomyces hazeniae TaxID=3075538 RepID=A0ABU2NU06_9ACTN|nr:hypothetical protein [Streptomyces sp. DSM 42041]MDT0380473.1 hypothetical protein [Streptomyces sp. DSM 42041]